MSELTRDIIMNMPAGREMNFLVATRFMGAGELQDTSLRNPAGEVLLFWGNKYESAPEYSSSWLDMKPVVDKLMELGDVFLEYWSDGEWFVSNGIVGYRDMEYSIKAHCDGKTTGVPSLPLAICRAALLTTI